MYEIAYYSLPAPVLDRKLQGLAKWPGNRKFMDMKLNEYKQLSEEEQYRILWDEGVLIDACMEGEVKKLLYAVHNFYIELWSHSITNKILWKLSFKQGKLLEKYLSKYPDILNNSPKK